MNSNCVEFTVVRLETPQLSRLSLQQQSDWKSQKRDRFFLNFFLKSKWKMWQCYSRRRKPLASESATKETDRDLQGNLTDIPFTHGIKMHLTSRLYLYELTWFTRSINMGLQCPRLRSDHFLLLSIYFLSLTHSSLCLGSKNKTRTRKDSKHLCSALLYGFLFAFPRLEKKSVALEKQQQPYQRSVQRRKLFYAAAFLYRRLSEPLLSTEQSVCRGAVKAGGRGKW